MVRGQGDIRPLAEGCSPRESPAATYQTRVHAYSTQPPESEATSVLDVGKSYSYVVAVANLNFAKPAGFMPIHGQRIIV